MPLAPAHSLFLEKVRASLASPQPLTRPALERIGRDCGILDKQEVKELTELAIVLEARSLSREGNRETNPPTPRATFDSIVALYERQPNLSLRTSLSVMLQQYSTAAPLAWLASWFCFSTAATRWPTFFEPSAGNGMLTIAAPGNFGLGTVNEIDVTRRRHLEGMGYGRVLGQDATKPFELGEFDVVLTNPPFGSIEPVTIDGYRIASLEHAMALNALRHLKPDGRAAIIIGGHTEWDEHGRIQAGKNRIFFNLLHHYYHVVDSINVDGKKLYSRMGTGFAVRLILIAGRKAVPAGVAPLRDLQRDVVVHTYPDLFTRVQAAVQRVPAPSSDAMRLLELEAEALGLELELLDFDGLGMPYVPASNACVTLHTDVPDAMGAETHEILGRVRTAVGGDFDVFVADRLGYRSPKELCQALSAEQTDAVALAIYNIEARHEGMIVGDQTGIGKGRVAAAVVRYGVQQGYKPVFLTEKPNLFSDLYRDLVAIGSGHLRPLIVNAKEDKTSVKDADGKVVHSAPDAGKLKAILKGGTVPAEYDFVMATYSQFNAAVGNDKKHFLQQAANDTILVLDEAHNTSGASNVGVFMQGVVASAAGVLFLSATFAKRPDNMPIYAAATAMRETGLPTEDLINAISDGGVALQEVISSQLVAEGQMLRRERHLDNMEVNYLVLDDKEQEHRAVADNLTMLVRGIADFQETHIGPLIKALDKEMAETGNEISERKGTQRAGVDNSPYFSKAFQVVNQMLFAIKADAVAERAILRLKEGKKPVIAFSSTMGSFLEQMTNNNGTAVGPGDVIPVDFNTVLRRGLESIMRYTVTTPEGKTLKQQFTYGDLSNGAQAAYDELHELIRQTTAGISLSPIDVIVQKLTRAGYSVAEVTGRKLEVVLAKDGKTGTVQVRKKENTADAFRRFNDNAVDVLLINQSGSTGASAHALPTAKVPAHLVRQRVMIVLQAELDINTEVQKRGRINRTGQILPPIYDYVSSAIPAEKRLNMMLRKKLKSLDANTSSNQKNSSTLLAGEDFLNKYGDQVVTEYLGENPELITALGLDKAGRGEDEQAGSRSFEAHKVSGRIAVMPTAVQQAFYDEVNQRYADLVAYLREADEYDLEMEAQDLRATTLDAAVISVGQGGRSAFGGDVMLEKVEMNALKKPLTAEELLNELTAALGGRTAGDIATDLSKQLRDAFQQQYAAKNAELEVWEQKQRAALSNDQEGRDEGIKLDAEVKERRAKLQKQVQDKYSFLNQFLHNDYNMGPAFKIGHDVLVPTGRDTSVTGVFLGFAVDTRQANPWVPSKIKLRVALPTSMKRLNIPLSMDQARALKPMHSQLVARQWAELVKGRQTDRTTGFIITGNLLKGLAENAGKLISYTTSTGEVRKGILKPDGWDPGKEKGAKPVMVPVVAAEKTLLALPVGQMLTTNLELTFFRRYDGFKVLVPGSKKKGGHLFLSRELLDLVDNGRFEKVADKMSALLLEHNLAAFLQVLSLKFGATLAVSTADAEKVRQAKSNDGSGKAALPTLPATMRTQPAFDELELLELEAEALALELELLAF
jgi:C-terminal domain on Strawberry notch homologue/P-loop containing NTP hydrolase pore-1